jgi:uncharacterized membrane protein
MELDDLKQSWQNAGDNLKTETDLAKMTKVAHHPTLKKIRVKLVAETVGLLLFLIIYYDWFDGDTKPLWANIALVSGVLLYLLNNVVGYISMARPVQNLNLKLSVQKYLADVKRFSWLSLGISFLYSICLVAFFSSVILFTKEKALLVTGLVIILLQMIFFSQRTWGRWIKSLQAQVNELTVEENA